MFFKMLLTKFFLKEKNDGKTSLNIVNLIILFIMLLILIFIIYKGVSKVAEFFGYESTEVKLERTKHNLAVQKEVTEQYKKNLEFVKKKSEAEYNISTTTLKKVNELDKNISLLKTSDEKVDEKVVKEILKEEPKQKQHKRKIVNKKMKTVELNHTAQPDKTTDKPYRPKYVIDKIKYVREGYKNYMKVMKARQMIMNIKQDTKDKK